MAAPPIGRRHALAGLLAASGLGLRALSTGLPPWFIAAPRRVRAEDVKCALDRSRLQALVLSASSAGEALSCNCPGTYDSTALIHPDHAAFLSTPITLGDQVRDGAAVWAGLSDAVRARTLFFHHRTQGTVHGDHPAVMRLSGKLAGNEMLCSALAKLLAPCLGSVQAEPVAVGLNGNALESVSFAGRTTAAVSPLQLKQLLSGLATDPLVALRPLRDRTLDALNELVRDDATGLQRAFLDAVALSQRQLRTLSESLAETVDAIQDDGVAGQALAAAALLAANVTPVVTLHIPFGGDNHEDGGLRDEIEQHTASDQGVAGVQLVLDALTRLGLSDRVTFATASVFGRNLNGVAKTESRNGRDHFGLHGATMMVGKNVRPGVIGGVAPVDNGSAIYGAAGIDVTTGGVGHDVPPDQTQVAMARTLGAVLGLSDEAVDPLFVATAGGAVVRAALR